MKISIIIPTCFRLDLFTNWVNTLKSTTQGWDIEIVTIIDNDDDTKEFADKNCDIVNFIRGDRRVLDQWNLGLSLSHGEIIMLGMDDQVFYPSWLDYAMESWETKLSKSGMVGMNDLAYDGNLQLSVNYLFDRIFCKEVFGGVLAPPVYNYYCADSELNAKAKMLGKYYWDKRSIVEHLHPAHGKRESDKLDQLKIDNNWMELDNKIFEDRKARGFPIEWESLI